MSCPVYFAILAVFGLWLSEVCVCGPTDVSKIGTFVDLFRTGTNNNDEVTDIHVSIHRGKKQDPMDCSDVHDRHSGVYRVKLQSRVTQGPISVLCDMDDDGGGWTVIQRRGDFDSTEDYFYRNWSDYKIGFGDLLQDFWIGGDNMFALTNQRLYTLKVDLRDWEGNVTYATYDDFWVDDELHNYKLHVNGYRGTAGDSFSYHNGFPFTTKDRKNNPYDKNCAEIFKGAWWFASCHISNLNGLYLKGSNQLIASGVYWYTFRGFYYSLQDSVMKVRPKNYYVH